MRENFSQESRRLRGLEQHVRNAVSFDDLYLILRGDFDEIPGTGHLSFYTPDQVCDAIEHVRKGEMELRYVTEEFGIQEKVAQLLSLEKPDIEV